MKVNKVFCLFKGKQKIGTKVKVIVRYFTNYGQDSLETKEVSTGVLKRLCYHNKNNGFVIEIDSDEYMEFTIEFTDRGANIYLGEKQIHKEAS